MTQMAVYPKKVTLIKPDGKSQVIGSVGVKNCLVQWVCYGGSRYLQLVCHPVNLTAPHTVYHYDEGDLQIVFTADETVVHVIATNGRRFVIEFHRPDEATYFATIPI